MSFLSNSHPKERKHRAFTNTGWPNTLTHSQASEVPGICCSAPSLPDISEGMCLQRVIRCCVVLGCCNNTKYQKIPAPTITISVGKLPFRVSQGHRLVCAVFIYHSQNHPHQDWLLSVSTHQQNTPLARKNQLLFLSFIHHYEFLCCLG